MPEAQCYPITVAPGLSRLYLDFVSRNSALRSLYGEASAESWLGVRPPRPAHWRQLVSILAEQNPAAHAAGALETLRQGGGAVLTGQQVGLFGGPLFTPFKAATALARARRAGAQGDPHAAIFWLASEDHDFAEVQSVTFPLRRELRTLTYRQPPHDAVPVGGILLGEQIVPLLEEAGELIGYSEALELLNEAYRPGRTLAQAFGDFYRGSFAQQGLLVFDPCSRAVHHLGAPVLRSAIEQADELHAALLGRNTQLETAGYHAQVAVAPNGSLLFLLDAKTGARIALKRTASSAAEPNGIWQAGRERFSSADLLGLLDAEPERISPAALLRPVFQDHIFGTSLTIGGPAEIAYFAQSAVLFERILGRITPVQPRFSATLIEPDTAELLRRHELGLERVFTETEDSLAQLLAVRAIPVEGKRKLAKAGNALETELSELVEWMRGLDSGLGRSAEISASKMRYQMNRLRRLAANFQLQREASLARHAQAIAVWLFPGGHLQERTHAAAWYFGRHGFELAEDLVRHAADACPGHAALWM